MEKLTKRELQMHRRAQKAEGANLSAMLHVEGWKKTLEFHRSNNSLNTYLADAILRDIERSLRRANVGRRALEASNGQ
jgi:hypothetical protein